MIQSAHQKPDTFIYCPSCGKGESKVNHCEIGFSSAWYCDDCGVSFKIARLADGSFDLTLTTERKERTRVTLESSGPVRIVVEGLRLVGGDIPPEPEEENHDQYFYDEHTCPINYLQVLKVIDPSNGNEDPHGIFAYVKTEPWESERTDETK